MRRGRAYRLAACVLSLGVIATGCSDDGDAEGETGSDATSTTAASTDAPDEAVEPATGEPIVVGFHSLEGGVISLPEYRIGWETGVEYVNQHGGVGGRPIESIICNTDGSPESSIDCANRFIEEGAVVAVQGIDIGADAMLPVLGEAGLAEIGIVPLGSQQGEAVGDAFYFGSAGPGYTIAALLALQGEGAETIRYLAADIPGSHAANDDYVEPLGEELGLDASTIYYNPAGPDWASLVSTAVADGADAIGTTAAAEPDCIAMMSAITQVAFDGPVFAGACSAFVDALGAETVAGTITYTDLWLPDLLAAAPSDKEANVQTYIDEMTAAGHDDLVDSNAQTSFDLAVNVADALGQIAAGADLTPQSVRDGMATVSGERFMGTDYNCDGSAWPGLTSCSLGVLLTRVVADGTRELVGDGYLDLTPYRPAE